VKIAQLSYTFGFNGLSRPAGHQWMANLIDAPTILADAHRARAAGAEIVVVSLHWGTEYSHAPNAMQVSLAKKLMASPDIDLILGCHAHVVQPMTKVNGKWVVYGMGNEVAHHAEPINDNREGILTRFTFTETTPGHWVATSGEAIPIWMQLGPDRLTLPAAGSVIYKRIMAYVNAPA
jgi:poly-gamma-glutamate synthesis protein (capsule biosynthesis protein)